MALPKRKISKSRKGKRRGPKKAEIQDSVKCKNCGENKTPHMECKSCGEY